MGRLLAACALVASACVTTPAPTPPAPIVKPPVVTVAPVADLNAEPRRALEGFLAAANEKRFEQVRTYLSRPLRDRYSPAALQRDFDAEPVAKDRLRMIAAHLDALVARGEQASLEWAPGHTLLLLREPDGWRVASLD
ncbi:MAG: hypothetical protein U0228_33940 [Myxococcaceae bacterium]